MPNSHDVRYFGVDLAWGYRSRTGIAVLDGRGRLVESRSVRADDEIVAVVQRHAADTVVAAIDAPLVVPNETGRRACEARVGELFGRFFAGAYPANRGNRAFVPEPRGARLAARLGWKIDPEIPPARGRRVCIEVYPHPAMVALFALEAVIPYKAKAGRDLEALKSSFQVLLNHAEAVCGPVLALPGSARWRLLRATAEAATRKSDLGRIEDEIDAIFCAYLAWLWATDRDALIVLGTYADGYIVTPPPPQTPAVRTLPAARPGGRAGPERLAIAFRRALPRLTDDEAALLARVAAETTATADDRQA